MGDERKAPAKPVQDARVNGAAACTHAVAWWPASRLMLDIIKQG